MQSYKKKLSESNPVNIKLIKEKITKNANNKYSNFVLVESAVSNFTGKATFHTKHENNPGNQYGALNPKYEETFKVDVISIDEYFKNKRIKEIPLMKIDTEGFDAPVLFGSNQTLNIIQAIVFECHVLWKKGVGSGDTLQSAVEFLYDHGFLTYQIGRKYFLKLNKPYWNDLYNTKRQWSNCLALKKDHIFHLKLSKLC